MDKDYIDFCDDVLVALAEDQEPPGLGYIRLDSLCERYRIDAMPTWLELVGPDLEQRGYGHADNSGETPYFLINGAGLAKATQIRRDRAPKSAIERFHAVRWRTWAAVATIVAAGAALLALI